MIVSAVLNNEMKKQRLDELHPFRNQNTEQQNQQHNSLILEAENRVNQLKLDEFVQLLKDSQQVTRAMVDGSGDVKDMLTVLPSAQSVMYRFFLNNNSTIQSIVETDMAGNEELQTFDTPFMLLENLYDQQGGLESHNQMETFLLGRFSLAIGGTTVTKDDQFEPDMISSYIGFVSNSTSRSLYLDNLGLIYKDGQQWTLLNAAGTTPLHDLKDLTDQRASFYLFGKPYGQLHSEEREHANKLSENYMDEYLNRSVLEEIVEPPEVSFVFDENGNVLTDVSIIRQQNKNAIDEWQVIRDTIPDNLDYDAMNLASMSSDEEQFYLHSQIDFESLSPVKPEVPKVVIDDNDRLLHLVESKNLTVEEIATVFNGLIRVEQVIDGQLFDGRVFTFQNHDTQETLSVLIDGNRYVAQDKDGVGLYNLTNLIDQQIGVKNHPVQIIERITNMQHQEPVEYAPQNLNTVLLALASTPEFRSLLDITSVQWAENKGKFAYEYEILGNRYRIKDDMYFNMSRPQTGNGMVNFVEHLYDGHDEAVLLAKQNSVSKFMARFDTAKLAQQYDLALQEEYRLHTEEQARAAKQNEVPTYSTNNSQFTQSNMIEIPQPDYVDFLPNIKQDKDDLLSLSYGVDVGDDGSVREIDAEGYDVGGEPVVVPESVQNESIHVEVEHSVVGSSDEQAVIQPEQHNELQKQGKQPADQSQQIVNQSYPVPEQSFIDRMAESNTQNVQQDFDALASIRMDEMKQQGNMLDFLSLSEFLMLASEYAKTGIKEKSIFQIKHLAGNDFIFAPDRPSTFTVSLEMPEYRNMTPTAFIRYISEMYRADADSHIERINHIVEPYIFVKVKRGLQMEMEEHLADLIAQKQAQAKQLERAYDDPLVESAPTTQHGLSAQTKKPSVGSHPEHQVLPENNAPVDTHVSTMDNQVAQQMQTQDKVAQEQPVQQDKTDQQIYEELLGFDRAAIEAPLSKKLSDYCSFRGMDFKIYPSSLYRSLAFKHNNMRQYTMENDVKDNVSILTFSDRSGLEIEAWYSAQDEGWKINNAGNSQGYFDQWDKSGIIPMFQALFRYRNDTISAHYIHRKIAEARETSFLDSLSKPDILLAMGAERKKKDTYEYGNLKISLKAIDNGHLVSIWNNEAKSFTSTVRLMQHLMAEDAYVDFSQNSDDPRFSFKTAKEKLRDIYFGMSRFERMAVLDGGKNDDYETQDNKKWFSLMLPKPSHNSNMMVDYLAFKRCINPLFIDELNGSYLYQGNYDYNRTQISNVKHNRHDDVVWYPVVTFVNEQSASVRGCSEMSEHIKQSVTGSSMTVPYHIPPSKLYTNNEDDGNHFELVCVEAAIDALSYRCLHPNAHTFSMFGIDTTAMVSALKEFFDVVSANDKNSVRIVYAMDNVKLDEDGKAMDKASRANYFNVIKTMSDYCFTQYRDSHIATIRESGVYDADLVAYITRSIMADKNFGGRLYHGNEDVKQRYTEEMADRLRDAVNEIKNVKMTAVGIDTPEFKDKLGYELFNMAFIKTGVFAVETPSHPELGEFKDWNEMLEAIVCYKAVEANPSNIELTGDTIKDGHTILNEYYKTHHADLQALHDQIVLENNPNMSRKMERKRASKPSV